MHLFTQKIITLRQIKISKQIKKKIKGEECSFQEKNILNAIIVKITLSLEPQNCQ